MFRPAIQFHTFGLACWLVLAGFTLGLAQPVQRLTTGFEGDVSRYRWVGDVLFARQLGLWDVYVENTFASEAFLLNRDVNDVRDENVTQWRISRSFNPRTAGVVYGRADWFSQNQASSQEVYGGILFQPRPFLQIEPALGIAWDRRLGVALEDEMAPSLLDNGPAFGFRMQAQPPPVGGYNVGLNAAGSWQIINPRRGRSVQTRAVAERTLESARLTIEGLYTNFRRDAYQPASFLNRGTDTNRLSQTIEATTTDTVLTSLTFSGPIRTHMAFDTRLDFTTNRRFIRTFQTPVDALFFDTDFTRQFLEAEAAFNYTNGDWRARIAIQRGITTERRELANRTDLPPNQAASKGDLLRQAEFDREVLGVRAEVLVPVGRRIALRFNGASNILRHDTPEANQDDRDEVFHNGELGILFRLREDLQADMRMFGTYYHTVYLRSERSAENNRRFALHFQPTLRWRPGPATRVELNGAVRATYTVDDFQIEEQSNNDQSARELRYAGTLEQRLSDGVQLQAEGSFSHLLLGRLIWDSFAEIPFDTLRTTSGWLRLQVGRRWIAEVGLRFFIRRDFDRSTTVRYPRVDEAGEPIRDETGQVLLDVISRPGREWIRQVGPTGAISWTMSRNSELRIDGWLQFQHIYQKLFGTLPDAAEDRIRTAAQTGTTRLVPNLTMQIIWNF